MKQQGMYILLQKQLSLFLEITPKLKCVLFCVRSTGLLESGMFVNIHQSGIKSEPTVLMTPDKVYDDMTAI